LASYDDEKIWILDNYNILRVDSDKLDIKFVLGLLNSRIINFYFRNMFIDVNIKTNLIEKLPLVIPEDQNRVVKRVDRMLSLMNSLNELNGKVVDKTVSIKNDVKQVDRELNDFMYDLYHLTKDEKKIVEDTFK
jgi:adenine-specific DNA-methyltransferase